MTDLGSGFDTDSVLARKWNFYSKNNFKIQTCLFTKHESLQGDSPRVHPNILKCSLHSLVTKGIRLVGFATRTMVCESPTHYLIVSKLISDPWGGREGSVNKQVCILKLFLE